MDEYKGPGSVYAIFEWHAKQQLNASGDKPVFVKPEVVEKKKKAAPTSVKIAGTGSNGNLEVLLSACPKLTELGMESTRTTGRVDNIARLVYAHMEHGLST